MCNYKREHGIRFNKQIPRTNGSDKLPKVVSRHERDMSDQLPCYFHNANHRASMSFITEKSLRKTKKSTQPVYEVPSSLNEKKSFRIDPNLPPDQQSPSSNKHNSPKKRGADFDTMLEKFGYTSKAATLKPRKRQWHIKDINFTDSSSSDNE